MDFSSIMLMLKRMLETSVTTIELFTFTLLFALPLGLIVSFGRMSHIKPIRWATQVYLLVMRGTPLMLQLIFFWFGLGLGSNFGLSRLQAAIVAFTFNYAAYFAEIYRGGIESIPVGQHEAANVLGFSKSQTFFRIILPQVIKKILPPMCNECMTLVKDTSLATIISVVEITALAKKIQAEKVSILPIVVAGAFYLIMNTVVSKGFSITEKKLSYYR
jgi:polar amino acid transport system permease protein